MELTAPNSDAATKKAQLVLRFVGQGNEISNKHKTGHKQKADTDSC
jgi:hypothetical protein